MSDYIRLLREIVQSSNINFLIGAGASQPYIPVLGDIEAKIESAGNDNDAVLVQEKRYVNEVMKPCVSIVDGGTSLNSTNKKKFDAAYRGYVSLFDSINKVLLKRKGTLLNKQANIFTTNIDIFMERVLEDLGLEYNDGFSGHLNPAFQIDSFHKSIFTTSAHFGNVSEIPTFNIIKLHGSLSWALDPTDEALTYSKLGIIEKLDGIKDDKIFQSQYDSLQIVNPSKTKFEQTIMGVTYYELLRMYSNELERENSVLFVIGFSMADEHIRKLTLRVASSNPTLKIYIFSHKGHTEPESCEGKPVNDMCGYHKYHHWFSEVKYKNIEIFCPDEEKEYDLRTIVPEYFEKVIAGSDDETTNQTSDLSEGVNE